MEYSNSNVTDITVDLLPICFLTPFDAHVFGNYSFCANLSSVIVLCDQCDVVFLAPNAVPYVLVMNVKVYILFCLSDGTFLPCPACGRSQFSDSYTVDKISATKQCIETLERAKQLKTEKRTYYVVLELSLTLLMYVESESEYLLLNRTNMHCIKCVISNRCKLT